MQDKNKDLALAHGSMAFFHFLQERPAERFSRFEAYCFMLDKACANYRPQNVEPKWIPAIGRGQFFITKTELAASWHWHRATVRWFLGKLSEFGHLSVEEHLKGMLCTMHHLIIPDNPSVAVAYNFDAMAKYAMYSYARGTHDARQTGMVCGQIERSASFMLDGNLLSPYTQRQLEEVRMTILHYALESTLAHRLGNVPVDDELRYNETIAVKRLYELLTEHLGGNWADLLTLISSHTELALGGLVQSIHAGRTERGRIWKSLLLEAGALPDPPAYSGTGGAADGASEGASPHAGDGASAEDPTFPASDTAPSDNSAVPSDDGATLSDKETKPDEQSSEDDASAHEPDTVPED